MSLLPDSRIYALKRGAVTLTVALTACTLPKSTASNVGENTLAESEALALPVAVAGPEPLTGLGIVEYIDSTALAERRQLNVFLPPGYEEDENKSYPVIYLLDGAVGEDYHHVTGLVQFLVMYQLMPASIVVGIANVDRYRDFTHPTTVKEHQEAIPTSGGSARFREFLAKELPPFIETRFRTEGTTTLIGQSLGALLASEVFLKTPGLFDHYLIVSPSFWWDDGTVIEAIETTLAAGRDHEGIIYLSVGTEPPPMEEDVKRFVAALEAHAPETLQWYYEPLPDETHATILHRALYRGFERIYGETHPGL